MSNVTQKRKHTAVSIKTKLEILEKIDRNISVKDIMEEYGLGRRTIYDIIASKQTIINYTLSVEPGMFTDQSSIFEKVRMKKPKFGDLDKAVYDWYKQQRSTGLLVKGSCIQAAAERFAKFLNVENFNASSGWLQRFRDRHGISNRRIVRESKCASVASVAPFVELQQLPTLLNRNSHISSTTSDPVKLEDIIFEDVTPITEVPVTMTSDIASVSSPSTASFTRKEPELYHLQYSDHVTTILAALAKDEEFMDVTLIAQGQSIKAHKSVLSAMSSYFHDVLRDNPCQHPVIIMPHDVLFEDLVSIISYIYKGEVTVAADKMMSVLKVAKILQISGMASSDFVRVDGVHMGSSFASTSDFSASSPSTGTSAMHNIHSTIMPNSKPIKNLKRCKRKNTSPVLLGKNSLAVVNHENSSVATSANQQGSLIATPQKFSTMTKHQNSSVVACPSDNSLMLASHTCDTSVTDTQLKVSNNPLSSSSLSWDSLFTRISNPEPIVQEATSSLANSKPSDSMNCIDDGVIKEEIIEVDEEEF